MTSVPISTLPLSAATVLISTLFNAPVKWRRPDQMKIAAPILDKLIEQPSAIALIEGPSGSGKSTLLRRVARHAQISGAMVFATRRMDGRSRSRAIDYLCDLLAKQASIGLETLRAATDLLTICGLGEPAIWLRRVCALSDSEQDRFTIACALARAIDGERRERPYIIVIDEFLSTLDRITAQATARALSRLSQARPLMRILAATAHTDLASFLEPSILIRRTPRACDMTGSSGGEA
jgi:ABC-type ATPase with predicted acetyltransferase domain